MKLLLQWLYPGLNIKRWMLLFSFGLAVGIRCCSRYELPGLWAD